MADEPATRPFDYHLELTPQQLKITHTALRSLLDDFGHAEPEIHALIHAVLDKLPDEHAIRAIRIDQDDRGRPRRSSPSRSRPPSPRRDPRIPTGAAASAA